MTRRNKEQLLTEIHNHGVNIDTREIFLNSYICDTDDDPGLDYRSSIAFIKNLRLLEHLGENPILIHLTSIGGGVDDGLAIYDAIKTSPLQVTILVHGYALSMGVMILQAADNRVMMPNSYLMIHDTSVNVGDKAAAAEAFMEFHKSQSQNMIDILCNKCAGSLFAEEHKLNLPKVKSYIKVILQQKQDWYLDANGAVYHGLADAIIGIKQFMTISSLNV